MELRPPRRADVTSLATWLPAAALHAGCAAWPDEGALRAAAARSGVLAGIEDGPTAFLAYDLGAPVQGAVRVRFLAVAPDRRRLGVGGRAALALERRLARSAREVYVAVPAHPGLALYFWLRLGYRPLIKSEWPAPLEDATWMVRSLH